jgi:hypothetical protein
MSFTKFLELDQFPKEVQAQIKDYTCALCQGIYNDPVVDLCGHVFCAECFQTTISLSNICPVNKSNKIIDSPKPVPFLRNVLDKQDIVCKYGCDWRNKPSTYRKHVDKDCPKAPFKCKNDGCNVMVTLSSYDQHLDNCMYRLYKCNFCQINLPLIDTQRHNDECPNIEIQCHQCGFLTERCKLTHHIEKECENTKLQCVYSKLGCEDIVLRKDFTRHLDETKEHHSKVLIDYITNLGARFDTFKKKQEDVMKELGEKIIEEVRTMFTGNQSKSKAPVLEEQNKTETPAEQLIGKKRGRKPKNKPLHLLKKEKQNTIDDYVMYEDDENKLSDKFIYYTSTGIKALNDRTFRCEEKANNVHKFGITNIQLNASRSWVVLINKKVNGWLGLGVCDRITLEKNDYKFSNSLLDHGCFMLSSNGFAWNCKNKEENNKMYKAPQWKEGDKIKFTYDLQKEILNITVRDFKLKLTNVKGNLSPFAIFLAIGDEVTFLD